MIKELFLALILGALLGFGITGTYVAIRKNQNPITIATTTPTPSISNSNLPTPTTSITNNNQDHQVNIDSPINESISSSSQITLKGSTTANSSIIIITSTKIYYTSSDKNGNFTYDITLESGVNLIQIDSINSNDDIATNKVMITYSTAKF